MYMYECENHVQRVRASVCMSACESAWVYVRVNEFVCVGVCV